MKRTSTSIFPHFICLAIFFILQQSRLQRLGISLNIQPAFLQRVLQLGGLHFLNGNFVKFRNRALPLLLFLLFVRPLVGCIGLLHRLLPLRLGQLCRLFLPRDLGLGGSPSRLHLRQLLHVAFVFLGQSQFVALPVRGGLCLLLLRFPFLPRHRRGRGPVDVLQFRHLHRRPVGIFYLDQAFNPLWFVLLLDPIPVVAVLYGHFCYAPANHHGLPLRLPLGAVHRSIVVAVLLGIGIGPALCACGIEIGESRISLLDFFRTLGGKPLARSASSSAFPFASCHDSSPLFARRC
mmetsp:Transcript_24054/g.58077  ORF Transcript_24054/g.58077 Transcript_24054/m.58077 type:complete len:292 (+) Transcript_24054:106-981(+)